MDMGALEIGPQIFLKGIALFHMWWDEMKWSGLKSLGPRNCSCNFNYVIAVYALLDAILGDFC